MHAMHRSGMVLFPIRFGVVSYTIRILMYPDVSRVYPVEYMYPWCILMYLKCILNALLHSKRIHVLDILHVFYTYPKRV